MKRQMGMVVLLAVLGACGVASADTVVFSEDFTGTVGADISTLGWTKTAGTGSLVIADSIVTGEGTSMGGSWTVASDMTRYQKAVGYTVGSTYGVDETVEVTFNKRRMTGDGQTIGVKLYSNTSQMSIFLQAGRDGYVGQNVRSYYEYMPGYTDRRKCEKLWMDDDLNMVLKIAISQTAAPTLHYSFLEAPDTWYQVPVTNDIWGTVAMKDITTIEVYAANFDDTDQASRIDNIEITATPEPATLGLLLIGGGLALLRKRR